jgi:hypothetical protein
VQAEAHVEDGQPASHKGRMGRGRAGDEGSPWATRKVLRAPWTRCNLPILRGRQFAGAAEGELLWRAETTFPFPGRERQLSYARPVLCCPHALNALTPLLHLRSLFTRFLHRPPDCQL